MTGPAPHRTTTLGTWLLAAVVPASALAIGSLLTWILLVIALSAALACVLLWWEPPPRSSRASDWVLLAFAILLGMTVLQALPLPAGVVAAVAPANADIWSRALTPLHEAGPSWHPLTVAPPATHVEILKGFLYGCVFLGALRIALAERGSIALERIVVGAACIVALSSLAHPAVNGARVFGLYSPRNVHGFAPGRIGPLLNPNHLAAYLNVGACVAASAALATRRRSMPRPLAVGAALLLAGTSVWAGSRGGTASLVLGGLLLAALTFYQRKRHSGIARAEALLVLGSFGAAAVFLGIASSDIARGDLAGHDTTKLSIIRTASRLVAFSPIFGTGRGTFETVFPLVNTDTVYMTFLRAEDIVVQWTSEWGLPATIVGAAALMIAMRPMVVLAAARPPTGAWVALVVVFLHDFVDFHLEIPGVVTLTMLCVALVVSARGMKSDPRPARFGTRRLKMIALATAAATVMAAMVVVPNMRHSLWEDRDSIAHAALDTSLSAEQWRTEIRAAILRYPAEPYFPLAGGIHAQRVRDESAVPWVARALERYPTFGRAHYILARSLASHHRAQARLEYRLAYTTDRALRPMIEREAAHLVDDFDSALELVADDADGAAMLESLATSLPSRLPATSVQLDAELERRAPRSTGPLRRRVQAAIVDVAAEEPWCSERSRCLDEGIAAAKKLVALDGTRCEPHVLLASLRIMKGEVGPALDDLARNLETTTERATCLRELVRLSFTNHQTRRADMALEQALKSGCGTREDCVALYVWAGTIEEGRGHFTQASNFYGRAAELAPENDAYLASVVETATRAGLFGAALQASERLAARHPDDPRWRARASELRAKVDLGRAQLPH
jgi:tetratricopeptide (TPR) repeat protein